MALPERIGRYVVTGLLGQGAMGVVYRGRDEALEREVALKVMAGSGVDDEARKRFEREAKAAARLQHPNIVTIYELGVHEGSPFMALELLEGVDLQRAIEGGLRPNPKVTLPIVLQLLAGLGHAHEHGIVHRDVKPSNVFLPRGRPAKIMDFGVARLGAGLTTAGMVVGTPNYMSPEQVRAGEVDGRSDLFSAGLILYELVTGEKTYRADTIAGLLYKIAHEPPDLSLIPRGPDWEHLNGVLARALAHERDERYPDAAAMISDLERALTDLGGSPNWTTASDAALLVKLPPRPAGQGSSGASATPLAAASGAPHAATAPSRRPALLLAAALGAGAVAVLAFALLSTQGTRPEPPPVTLRPAGVAPGTPTPAPAAAPTTVTAAAPTVAPSGAAPSLAPPATPRPAPATPTPTARPAAAPDAEPVTPDVAPAEARLDRAETLYEQGRYASALAEAKAVLRREPSNTRAKTLVEDAEAALVVESRIKSAREALRRGDTDAALVEIKAGLAVNPSDARLLQLWREATQ